MLEQFVQEQGHKIASYYGENISGTKFDRPELGRLLMDSHRNDILLVEKIDRLTRLSNSDWMTLKKQTEQHELRIVSLDVPTSWQAVPHKDWLSRRQRQKQGIERAHTLGKYRGNRPIRNGIRKSGTTGKSKNSVSAKPQKQRATALRKSAVSRHCTGNQKPKILVKS